MAKAVKKNPEPKEPVVDVETQVEEIVAKGTAVGKDGMLFNILGRTCTFKGQKITDFYPLVRQEFVSLQFAQA